jgi:minor histocompatibility antigen H13
MAAHNLSLTASYVALFSLWGISGLVVIPVPVNLIVTSSLILFIGCHRSLRLLATEAEGGARKEDKEMLSAKDAYLFPFIGSGALFSLYVAFKYFDKDTVNLLLSLYFSVVGVFTLTGTLSPVMSRVVKGDTKYGIKKTLPLLGEIDARFTFAEMICLVLSTIFSYYYFQTKHFLMNNVLGISFCIQSIERISIGSYKIGAILLVGLFFYDIFWVFGTDVMVTVAKSFDGPIKLLFPRVLPTLAAKGAFECYVLCVMVCCAVAGLGWAVLCYAMLCYAMLCYAMLCYAVLRFVLF